MARCERLWLVRGHNMVLSMARGIIFHSPRVLLAAGKSSVNNIFSLAWQVSGCPREVKCSIWHAAPSARIEPIRQTLRRNQSLRLEPSIYLCNNCF